MPDFNFMIEPAAIPVEGEYVGPSLKNAAKMTPRKFASSVLSVFEELGGASWLLVQAKADPKSFLDLLKKLIPKNVQLDNLAGFTVNLIDQFGNEVQINTNPDPAARIAHETSGQRSAGTATGGSLPLDLSSSAGQEVPQSKKNPQDVVVKLKETF